MAGVGETHWNWEERTRILASWLLYFWPVSVNTYEDHPNGWGLDGTSIDVWDPTGRGVPLREDIGYPIATYLLSEDSPCRVRWIIWQGYIFTPENGWEEYWDASDMHYDHLHVTID